MADTINPRELVLDILLDVEKKHSFSNVAINNTLSKYQYMDKQKRAFITRVAEGTIENQILLDYIISQFSKTKINKLKPVVRNVLRMSIYQIKYMDGTPDSAVCNEAVMLTKKRGLKALSGFVNGVLRSTIRGMDSIVYPAENKEPIKYLSIIYSMPEWIISDWLKTYDYNTVKTMIASTLQEIPTSVRINLSKANKDEVYTSLKAADIEVEDGYYVENALHISGYNYLNRVSDFKKGNLQVQDESSMLVGLVAEVTKDQHILDVCAAPGGKTFHVADLLQGTGRVISRDLTEAKVDKIIENLERQEFKNVVPEVHDALELDTELVEKMDIVLADLPCSGLGIMAKKNDIKYNITKEMQKELVDLQREILTVVHQYVKPGGVLIYSTCTINNKENQENVEWFTKNFPFHLESIEPYLPKELHTDTTKDGYIQLLPGIHKCDGFFVARLRRN